MNEGWTGIAQVILAGVSIVVDIVLVFVAARLAERSKKSQDRAEAKEAIEAMSSESANLNDSGKDSLFIKDNSTDKKQKKKAQRIMKRLKKQGSSPHEMSAVSFVIAFKNLFNGNEEIVVAIMQKLKEKKYIDWTDRNLSTGTVITIKKEEDTIDYISSCKSR